MDIIKKEVKMVHSDLVKIEHDKQDVLVNPYIGIEIKTILLRSYIDNYFKDERILENYIESEYTLILQIVDLCTDILIMSADGQIIIQIDDLIGSGLWEKIKNSIINYNQFRNDLDTIIKKIEDKKSIGYNFDRITNKLIDVLEKIANVDLSEKTLSELVKTLQKEIKDYTDKFGDNTTTIKKSVNTKRVKKE